MNEELNVGVVDVEMEDVVDCDTCESSGFWMNIAKTTGLITLGTIAVAGAVAVVDKVYGFSEKFMVKRLTKKGYVFYSPDGVRPADQDSDEDAE